MTPPTPSVVHSSAMLVSPYLRGVSSSGAIGRARSASAGSSVVRGPKQEANPFSPVALQEDQWPRLAAAGAPPPAANARAGILRPRRLHPQNGCKIARALDSPLKINGRINSRGDVPSR
ncbi:hypothetical protein KM043_014520 [Ampulex compressa]|nr:hypothetical protein KM043_014520 [Ampulex compressa]